MSYCLNPNCPTPQNPSGTNFCYTCGSKLLLKERYRAVKPIGQGGFGRTFLATDEDKPSKPQCVIKQFFPSAQGTSNLQKAAELFNQEAVQLDELGKHPQIPALMAYFTQDNWQYLVQEFIDGSTLAEELIQKGAFNESQIRQLLDDLLNVLQFVHSHQVIHRDIKPENIIRRKSDNKLVLVDFGAAKTTTGAALQKTGTSIGSPEYVAPEQSRGRAVFSSDIYSLGVTCIYLLTCMSPFDLYDLREDTWVWRQYAKHPVSNQLGKILDKMLENAINRRYQSVAEVLKDLNAQIPSATPIKAPNPTPVKPPLQSPPAANTTATSRKGQIESELEEMRSQFLNNAPAKPPNEASASQNPPSSTPGKAKSQIDLELEEMKSHFLGSTPPKNQTNS